VDEEGVVAMLPGKYLCVVCERELQPSPTPLGWSRIRYEQGICFECIESLYRMMVAIKRADAGAATAKEWNEKHPVGTRVRYHPIIGKDEGTIESATRSVAWCLYCGTPVVSIVGKTGGVALEALDVP
jgi:hypothetical protein